ncbi:cysteine-rich motor neuron 1 protein [Tachysurus ichikawai]
MHDRENGKTKLACIYNGVEYRDGDMFRMDACHFCRCQGGVSVCFTAQCGVLHCERYYVPEGECCPVCEDPIFPALNFAGCYVNGQILAHGDHWREDDCTFCQCVSGDARCVAAACGHNCLHPVTVPGECCPVCEGEDLCSALISGCTLKCPLGFQLDANGCAMCQCRHRHKKCKPVACTKDCPFGFV